VSEQTRLVAPTITPRRECEPTGTDCTQAAKYLIGYDPVPFVFPRSPIECYLDAVLRATMRAIETAVGVEPEFRPGELPVTRATLVARMQPAGTQVTLTEVDE